MVRSCERTALRRAMPGLGAAMQRAATSTSLLAEYAAARQLCDATQRFHAALLAVVARYTQQRLARPQRSRLAGGS